MISKQLRKRSQIRDGMTFIQFHHDPSRAEIITDANCFANLDHMLEKIVGKGQ